MATDTTLAGLDALDTGPAGRPVSYTLRAQSIWQALWPKIAALFVVWLIWELIHLSGWNKYVFPGPGVTLSNLWHQAQTGLLWNAIGTSVERAFGGYAIALVLGTVIGTLVARVALVRSAIGSLLTGLQTMPSLAWYPFAIILFGISTKAILFVITMAATPSIANAVIAGVDYTPPQLLKAGHMMGLRRVSLYRHLILPASLPTYVIGLKQAWAFSWHALIAGELIVIISNTPSIGTLLSADQDQTDMPSTIAIMIVILIIGIAVDSLFGLANQRIRQRWGLAG